MQNKWFALAIFTCSVAIASTSLGLPSSRPAQPTDDRCGEGKTYRCETDPCQSKRRECHCVKEIGGECVDERCEDVCQPETKCSCVPD